MRFRIILVRMATIQNKSNDIKFWVVKGNLFLLDLIEFLSYNIFWSCCFTFTNSFQIISTSLPTQHYALSSLKRKQKQNTKQRWFTTKAQEMQTAPHKMKTRQKFPKKKIERKGLQKCHWVYLYWPTTSGIIIDLFVKNRLVVVAQPEMWVFSSIPLTCKICFCFGNMLFCYHGSIV